MNKQNNILARLLQLFPSQKIKERWELKGRKEEVSVEIAKTASAEEIKKFAEQNIGLTKQIIYCCKPTETSNGKHIVLPDAELVAKTTSGAVHEHFYLIDLVYDVSLTDPVEETKLKFLWPVRVVFDSDHFRVHITLMEKNVASYFPSARGAICRKKNLEEWQIMDKICTVLGTEYRSSGLDLNKGVKALWANGSIDALSARWKEKKDTTTKTMDKDCLLRKDNPQAYHELMKSPLYNTSFKFIAESDDFPDHFWTNPTNGEVVISTFSETNGVAENVVREILKHN